MSDAIRTEQLVKHYGPVRALGGIDLEVREGEIFGFLGPNGAGKSTAIRILLDLIRPTGGRAAIFGHDCQRDSVRARALTGYLPSTPVFPAGMTAAEVFAYHAALRGGDHDTAYRDELIERLRLDTERPVEELSRGNQQKVGLIQALAPRPRLVILDEPTTGLDPLMQAEVEAILRELAVAGTTVFFSSHILEEVESVCDRVAIIRDGLLAAVFDLEEQRRLAPVRVEVAFTEPPPHAAFEGMPDGVAIDHLDASGARFLVRGDMDALIARLARCRVAALEARPPSLAELFVGYYSGQANADGAGEDGATAAPADAEATRAEART